MEAALNVLVGKASKPKKRCCELCEGEKAVGKYYVDPSESENHGWWRVCTHCADMVTRVGASVRYYKYSKEYKENHKLVIHPLTEEAQRCDHDWEKWSNVGEHDKKRDAVFDWMKCKHCGVYGKRFGLGQQPITDLMMEIDLSCCR